MGLLLPINIVTGEERGELSGKMGAHGGLENHGPF